MVLVLSACVVQETPTTNTTTNPTTPAATSQPAGSPTSTTTPATTPTTSQPAGSPTSMPDTDSTATPAATDEAPTTGEAPSGEGKHNFRLLISDERLAIGDFNELIVTIEKVSVMQAGGSGLIEFDVPTGDNTADLTKLQGDYALEILKVHLYEGSYTGVVAHIGEVTGDLVVTGDPITIKLPSSKININKPFYIGEGTETTFVFDIAVVVAGNEKSPQGLKYLLKPVISQSGADQPFKVLAPDAPTADAGADQTVSTGDTVQLDGSGSSDPEDDTLTYSWTLSVPDGSAATLSDATLINPTFVADVYGQYVATMVVNDGTSDSDPDSIEIEAGGESDESPTADAGPTRPCPQGIEYSWTAPAAATRRTTRSPTVGPCPFRTVAPPRSPTPP